MNTLHKMVFWFLAVVAALLLVQGCNNPSSMTDAERLKIENENAKIHQNILLNQAKKYISEKEYKKAKSQLEMLIEKYPSSPNADEAKNLLVDVNNAIKQNDVAEKEKLAKVTSKLRYYYDEMQEVTWYSDKNSSKYINITDFYLYFRKFKSGKIRLRLKIKYAGYEWLFIKKYIIKADNNFHTIEAHSSNISRDTFRGGVSESYDVLVDIKTFAIVNDIIKSKNTKVRFDGERNYHDIVITAVGKQALRNVLDAYTAFGGNLTFNRLN